MERNRKDAAGKNRYSLRTSAHATHMKHATSMAAMDSAAQLQLLRLLIRLRV